MKRLVRTGLFVVALSMACAMAVGSIVVGRALTAKSVQVTVEPGAQIDVDDGAIARLAGAIRIPTISRDDGPGSDFTALTALRNYLETSFTKVHATLTREIVNEHSLLLTWKGADASARPIVLMGHMDVVPVEPGTEASWTHGPFSGDVAEGFVWGRGTLDDKVGVLAILEAAEILLNQGFRPRQTMLLAFGHDEEIGGQAGAAMIAELLKSRGTRVEYVLDEGSAITDGIVPGLEPPAALIGIAEKGHVSVELTAVSSGGHSSMPPGQTAVGIVAAAVTALEKHPMPAAMDGPSAGLFERLGPEMTLPMKLVFVNRWLFDRLITGRLEASPTTNAIVRTTTAATIFEGGVKENVLPARARAVVNFRIKPGDTIDGVVNHVTSVVNDPRVKIRLLEPELATNPSPTSSTATDGYKTIERTIRQVIPAAVVAPSLVVGMTDSRHYQELADDVYRFLPFVLEPEDPGRIHGTNERIAVERYKNCVRFYVQMLINGQ